MACELVDTPVLVLDCQSTGASPRHGVILEIAWLVLPPGDAPDRDAIADSCVALPEGHAIPAIVGELTGISEADVQGVPTAAVVWQRILDTATAIADERGLALAPIHFARFERSFFDELHPQVSDRPSPLDVVCTHDIARRLFPGMPRLGLRALAGYFGHGAAAPRRSREHVWATAVVWRALVGELASRGITTREALATWSVEPATRSRRRVYPMERSKRLGLPEGPGVYRMLRQGGDVLYVGKATSLRRRVNSYFQKQTGVSDRLLEMLTQARDLDVTPTATALEAALLESDEIKRLVPPFNVALVSAGRSPWYASWSLDDVDHARRGRRRLGPFGSSWPARRLLALRGAIAELAGERDPTECVAKAIGGGRAELPPEIAIEALRRFVALAPSLDRCAVGRLGAAWWLEGRASEATEEPAIDEEPDAADESPEAWTADRVHRALVDVVTGFAWGVRRGRWLSALADSAVVFVDGVAARRLEIAGGRVVDRGDVDPDVALPETPAPTQPRRTFDLAIFDRMRVLSTELSRVVHAGGLVRVRPAGARELAGDRLRRLLGWV